MDWHPGVDLPVIPVAHGFSGKRGASIVPGSKARRQVIARFYGAKPQRCCRVRETCVAAETPFMTGTPSVNSTVMKILYS